LTSFFYIPLFFFFLIQWISHTGKYQNKEKTICVKLTPEYFQGLWGDRNTANFGELIFEAIENQEEV
jgi:hypothetical protein